jgi:hypothetical protein
MAAHFGKREQEKKLKKNNSRKKGLTTSPIYATIPNIKPNQSELIIGVNNETY